MEQVVDCAARIFAIIGGKSPSTIILGVWLHYAHREERLQAFELSSNDGAVGKGAEEPNVEMVSRRRWRESLRGNDMPPRTVAGWMVGHCQFRGG